MKKKKVPRSDLGDYIPKELLIQPRKLNKKELLQRRAALEEREMELDPGMENEDLEQLEDEPVDEKENIEDMLHKLFGDD